MDDRTDAQLDSSLIPQPPSLSTRRFRPYPKYQNSGAEWIGEIPSHWSTKRLKNLVHFQGGGTPSKENLEYWSGNIPWVSPKDVKTRLIRDTADKITVEAVEKSATNLIDPGTVLLVVRSGILNHSIPVAIAGTTMALNQDLKALIPGAEVLSKYLSYVIDGMQSPLLVEWRKEGATVESLELELIENSRFPLPPKSEQRAIAEFLDRETEKIDLLVAKKEQLIELLQEKRTALITHAVTKGLDSDVPLKDSGVEWLGTMPAHWEVCHLRRVIEKFVDYRGKTPEKVPTGIPLITAKNIKNQTIDFSLSEEFISEDLYASWMVRGLPEVGDVLVTTEAPLGESAQIRESNIALAQRIILLKADKEKVSNDYLKYHFASNFGKSELLSKATGSTAFGIKASHFKATLMTVPPINEQKRITLHVDKEIEKIDGFIAKIREGIDRLKEFRTALISAAVTGKIDVREEVA